MCFLFYYDEENFRFNLMGGINDRDRYRRVRLPFVFQRWKILGMQEGYHLFSRGLHKVIQILFLLRWMEEKIILYFL